MKKFEGSESWICWCLKLKTVKHSELFKVIEGKDDENGAKEIQSLKVKDLRRKRDKMKN